MQGGSVVKVEEEEETSLRERWVVTCGRRAVCMCGVGEERCRAEESKGSVRERKREREEGRKRERLISALPHAH